MFSHVGKIWRSTWSLFAEGRLSSCEICAKPSSSGHNLKMHMIAQAQALPMQTLKTFVLKQTMWLCNFSCRQFEDTFEKSKWRKVKQMQPMWLCLFSGRRFEDTFQKAQRRKVKQMQPMWLCIFWSRPFEKTFYIAQWRKVRQMLSVWLRLFSKS